MGIADRVWIAIRDARLCCVRVVCEAMTGVRAMNVPDILTAQIEPGSLLVDRFEK